MVIELLNSIFQNKFTALYTTEKEFRKIIQMSWSGITRINTYIALFYICSTTDIEYDGKKN